MATKLVTLKDNEGISLDISAAKFQVGDAALVPGQLYLKEQNGYGNYKYVGIHAGDKTDELVVDANTTFAGDIDGNGSIGANKNFAAVHSNVIVSDLWRSANLEVITLQKLFRVSASSYDETIKNGLKALNNHARKNLSPNFVFAQLFGDRYDSYYIFGCLRSVGEENNLPAFCHFILYGWNSVSLIGTKAGVYYEKVIV